MWKKLLFTAVTVTLVFAAVEAVLYGAGVRPIAWQRDPFVGFAANLPLYVSDSAAGEAMLVTAENKRGLFNVQRFARHKPAGVRRLFCLGGSTTYGHPYDDASSFSGWLRELLPCVDKAGKWEVINAGGISYASYRVAALMQELVAYEPDLFLVYTGHNEFLERRTYDNFFNLPPLLRETSALLSHTRTYTMLTRMLVTERAGEKAGETLPPEVDARLDHTIGPADYHRDDRQRRRTVEHLRYNLRRMVALARAAGAEVVFVTPAANLKDCSPFKSEHREGLTDDQRRRWSEAFTAGRRDQQMGDWQSALTAFRTALEIDQRYAEVHYRLGQCWLQLDQPRTAEQAFARARDEDICPLRAPAEVIETVRRVARETNCGCIDFAHEVGQWSLAQSGCASPGREMFLDHVHLSQELTSQLSAMLVDELARRGIVPAALDADCRSAAARQLATRLGPAERAVGLRNIAKVYSWAGKMEEAGPAALAALELMPDDRESLFIAGAYLKQTGQLERGTQAYRRALELEVAQHPDDVEARQFLAKAWAEQGELAKAADEYQAALQLRPNSIEAHCGLAAVLVKQRKLAEAREHLEQALRLDADYPDARAALQRLDHPKPDD